MTINPNEGPAALTATDKRRMFAALLRQDFYSFLRKVFATVSPGDTFHPNWHIDAIIHSLHQVGSGECDRLVINLPPRHLKSIIVSVAWPAWLLGRNPHLRIIVASYSAELAVKHANDFRLVVGSKWFRQAFPKFRIDPRKNTEIELQTTERGYRLAVSVGGALTGRGADLIIVDDPIKADDVFSDDKRERVNNWFDTTLLSRLNDKRNGAIVIVMQRLHVDDLSGHVLEKSGWAHLKLPAIAETHEIIPTGDHGRVHVRRAGEALDAIREPLHILEGVRVQMGAHLFSAQYQQAPVPAESEFVSWSKFKRFNRPPPIDANDQVIISWDTASKDSEVSDYSVGIVALKKPNDETFILAVIRGRFSYPALRKQIIETATQYPGSVTLIEEAGAGTSLIQDLRDTPLYVIPVKPRGDKAVRFMTAASSIEAGKVYLPENAPWLADFQKEVLSFPNSTYDDQVDALSQLLNWIAGRDRVRAGILGTYRMM